jgi:hypothetical protein
VIRFGYTNDQIRAVMQNSIDITFASSIFIFMPPKEAKNIAPGVNPGDSIPRTHKLRRSDRYPLSLTNILDHN